MKILLTILTTTTIATTAGVNLLQLNNSQVNVTSIDGKNYLGDKIYDIKFCDYINHSTFQKINDIYRTTSPIKAIKQLTDLFKNFHKEKDLIFKEADYERLSAAIYGNFTKILMVDKQTTKGVKVQIGFNQADFVVACLS